jgi:hypothetical protein
VPKREERRILSSLATHSPPAQHSQLTPAPPEAQAPLFSILLEVLLKPGKGYSFGGLPPKARKWLILLELEVLLKPGHGYYPKGPKNFCFLPKDPTEKSIYYVKLVLIPI